MQFIVLNSCFEDDKTLIEPQLQWIETELAKPSLWKVVLFHHAPFSLGPANSGTYWRHEYQTLQKFFVPLFEKYQVDLVLSGHVHLFERSIKEGVQYLVGGPAGGIMGISGGGVNPYSLFSKRMRTISQIEANPLELRVKTFGEDGVVVDEFAVQPKKK